MRHTRRSFATSLALLLALSQTGCWHFMTGARGFEPAQASASLSTEAVLRVNEAGVAWGNGEFGEELKRTLLKQGIFQRVHYPVEPRELPNVVIEVEALGSLDEAILWAIIAAGATGYFLFLPAPVLPYFEDYGVSCDVRVLEDGLVTHRFQIKTETKVIHAILADPAKFVPDAKRRVFRDLADRIADAVAGIAPS